jgi:hypothetical protein
MNDIALAVTDPSLPTYEIDEQLSILNGRIDGPLYDDLSTMTSVKSESKKFPADQFKHMIAVHVGNIKDEAKRASFLALTAPLVNAADPYTRCLSNNVPGAERVLNHFLYVLREWISVERWFCDDIVRRCGGQPAQGEQEQQFRDTRYLSFARPPQLDRVRYIEDHRLDFRGR